MIIFQRGNRTTAGLIKESYRGEPWIALHVWPIEPMAWWIRWVTSSWNIGSDWSPIVINCQLFRLSHNRPWLWVRLCIGQALPFYLWFFQSMPCFSHFLPWFSTVPYDEVLKW